MPSLSVLIGINTAVTILVVAAVTLSITLAYSIDAIHSIGFQHTRTIADYAGVQLDNYFRMPADSANALAAVFRGSDDPLPSENTDPIAASDLLAGHTLSVYRSATAATSCLAALRDGTFIRALYHPLHPDTHTFLHRNVPVKNQSSGAMYIDFRAWSYWTANGTRSPPGYEIGVERPTTVAPLFSPTGRLHLMDVSTFANGDRNKIFFGPPVIGQLGPNQVISQLSIYAAAYNSSGQSHGVVACGAGITQLAGFLRQAKTSSGAQLFVVGPDDRILSSTFEPFFLTDMNVPRTKPLEPGCASTAGTTASATNANVSWMCQINMADVAFEAARRLAARGAISTMQTGVEMAQFGKERFFLAIRRTELPNVFGYTPTLVVFIPEQDVIGQVRRGQMIAVGASVGVFVLAVAVSWTIVLLLLRPLDQIARRMHVAALLGEAENIVEDQHSHVREVAMLQTSYNKLNTAIQSFTRYVPRDVVQDLMKTGQLCEIQMYDKHCTVLFVDIASFTTMCERIETAELSHLLHTYFDVMSRTVIRHSGMIDKFIGDCIMAVWGAPFAVRHAEVRAALCALHMQRNTRVAPLCDLFDNAGEQLQVRVGVATGAVLAGNMGTADRMNYTVIGDIVNLAARLESLNKQFETGILICERTAVAIQEACAVKLLMNVAVVGRVEGERVYELLGLLPKQLRTHSASGDSNFTESATDDDDNTSDTYGASVRKTVRRRYKGARETVAQLLDGCRRLDDHPLVVSEAVHDRATLFSRAAAAYIGGYFAEASRLLSRLIEGHDKEADGELEAPPALTVLSGPCVSFLRNLIDDALAVHGQRAHTSWNGVWVAHSK